MYKKRRFLLFLALLFITSGAPAAEVSCSTLLNDSIAHAQSYLREIQETKGIRLILKDPSIGPEPASFAGGLLRAPDNNAGSVAQMFTAIPRRISKDIFGRELVFTPGKAVYDNLIGRPVRFASRTFLGHDKLLSNLVTVPLAIAMSIGVYQPTENYATQKVYQYQINKEITTHRQQYDDLIKTDYRFVDVETQELSGKLNAGQAEREAYFVKLGYTKYYEYMNKSYDPSNPVKTMNTLKNHYLFLHLHNLMEHGVQPTEGFLASPERYGPLSDDEKIELFRRTYQLYFEYQVILDHYGSGLAESNPDILDWIKRSEQDPFFQKLNQLYQSGHLSPEQFVYRLQEDAYWKAKFDQWEVLGITRLKRDATGKWTDSALTLNDIRLETLSEIAHP